ncbi:MAG TPA: maltotransferase domain-containing protein, partial [Burkholderiales bacterium]|nr:maltotransferase domain-containing protein [Burkholderiales bacterium]
MSSPPSALEFLQAQPVREGRARVVIEGITPQVDCGRFPIKRVIGEQVTVETDAYADGHDVLVCLLRHRHESNAQWSETAMTNLGNDRWRGEFRVERMGVYCYTVIAWVDRFLTWRHDLLRRVDHADILVAGQAGARLVAEAAKRALPADAARLQEWAQRLSGAADANQIQDIARDEELALVLARHADRRFATCHEPELAVTVDRERARYSSWYEMFPRSTSPEAGRHGTFRDCEARLSYVAELGFDVLYLPPIHPIGRTNRKGQNNALQAGPDDVGSPWAIGAAEGGHTSIHPELGTLEDFVRLRERARSLNIEIALDIAFQTSPDHPHVREHPEWFTWRPDGTVQYA